VGCGDIGRVALTRKSTKLRLPGLFWGGKIVTKSSLLIILASVCSAFAAPVPDCVPMGATLQYYIDNFQTGCFFDHRVWSGFSYSFEGNDGAQLIAASDIGIRLSIGTSGLPLNLGLFFDLPGFEMTGSQSFEMLIGYSIIGSPWDTVMQPTTALPIGPPASHELTATLCLGGSGCPGGVYSGTENNLGLLSLITFPESAHIDVNNRYVVSANGESITPRRVFNVWSATPDPSTLLLSAAGIAVIVSRMASVRRDQNTIHQKPPVHHT
jgi:hypothetical protein